MEFEGCVREFSVSRCVGEGGGWVLFMVSGGCGVGGGIEGGCCRGGTRRRGIG